LSAQSSIIDWLDRARRISARDAFDRYVFQGLLIGPLNRQEVLVDEATASNLSHTLARWVREAPATDALGQTRLLAARRPLRSLVLGFGQSPDFFLRAALSLRDQDVSQPNKLPNWKLIKLAILGDAWVWTPTSLDVAHTVNPELARVAAIAALDVCPLDTELLSRTSAIGNWLIEKQPIDLANHYLQLLQDSSFFVSYLVDSRRHIFKRAMVRQAAHLIRSSQLARTTTQTTPTRPRLTIVGELLFPEHAMFRCYAEALSTLTELFDVTLIADEFTRCAAHSLISHKQQYFPPDERDVGRLAALLLSSNPDIVLYPSVGMSYWTFALSLLRLAPLQLMSVGHPAPACSEMIDGVLLYSELASGDLPEYGRLIPYDRQPLPVVPARTPRSSTSNEVRPPVVAVNAAGIKLNPQFLEAVYQIMQRAPVGTELHFFPNAVGGELLALRRELGKRFPHAEVHSRATYTHYIETLSRADLILQSFPFGGTNTVMDALSLGIPMLCLRGEDLPSRVDPLILRHAGLDELCVDDMDGYVSKALNLLTNPMERSRIAKRSSTAFASLTVQQQHSGSTSLAEAILGFWNGHWSK
jgi:hypothetical protein